MATLALVITVPPFWPLSTVDAVALTAASASLGGGWPYGEEFFRKWLLSAAMPVVHWFELIFLGASIFTALKGILLSIQVYAILAVYAPDSESRAYALYDNVETITTVRWDRSSFCRWPSSSRHQPASSPSSCFSW